MVKHKTLSLQKILVFAAALVIVAAGGVTISLLVKNDTTDKASASAEATTESTRLFSFNANVAEDWHKGPQNKTSLVIFNADNSCFVSTEYKTGTVDTQVELEKITGSLTANGYTVQVGDTQDLSIETTSAGAKAYKLYQYNVIAADNQEKLYAGQEFGYIQLTGGYIAVEGYCDEATQLVDASEALRGIAFNN